MIEFDEAAHTYKVDGEPFASVTKVIAEAGLYGDATKYFSEYSRDRGRVVHRVIELYLKGELDQATVDPAVAGYFASWQAFEKDTGFFPGYIEHTLYSVPLRIAGRVDLIGPWNGNGAAIIDLKTGMTPTPATGIQLAGYEELYGSYVKRFALHLGAEGKYRLKEYDNRGDRAVFLAAVTLYHWRKANVKGET